MAGDFSTEAEQSVLGALLLDGGLLARIGDVRPKHFASEQHRAIYRAICDEREDSGAVDVLTVAERLRRNGVADDGMFSYLGALAQNTPSTANIEVYARLMREKAARRKLEALGARLAENAGIADLAELRREIASAIEVPSDDVSGLMLRRVADVQARPVRWLWPGRIARGKVTIIAGHPGLGKSQLCCSIAAVITQGALWQVDRTRCERGTVLIFSAEDDPEDTIRPRLEAAGADLSRVHVLEAVAIRETNGSVTRRGFSLVNDMPRLAAKLSELQDVALVVIDPISAFLGDTDSHQNAAVRAVLAPLAEVAAKHGAAVIAVSHLRKSAGGEAMHNITGSLAFVAAARAAYIVAKDQADPLRRLLLPAKNNLGDDQSGYAFKIEPCTIQGSIATSRILWESARVTVTADEALAPAEDREERSAIEEAGDFLRALLAEAPMPAKRLLAEAREAGHAEKTIRRAAKAIGVEQVKEGGHFGDGRQQWLWRLKMAKNPEDAQSETLASFSKVGHLQHQGTAPETPPTAPTTSSSAAIDRAAAAPARAADEPLPDDEVARALARLLAADACMPLDSATRRLRQVVTHHGVALVRNVLRECQQRALRGKAALDLLTERRDLDNVRRARERREDCVLATRMAKRLGQRLSDMVLRSWATTIRNMREDEGLTREQIWAVFERFAGDEPLRHKVSNPDLLRHYWQELSAACCTIAP